MSLSLHCPFCKARLKIPEKLAGSKVRCPKCDSQLLAPAAASTPAGTPSSVESSRPTRQASAFIPDDSGSDPYATPPSAPSRSTFVPDGEPAPRQAATDEEHQICSTCNALLLSTAESCPHCGNYLKKKKKRRKKKKKTTFSLDLDPLAGRRKSLQPANWADIYQTPFDVENVVTESIMLSVWSVVYFFLFLSLLTPLVHPIFIFFLMTAFVNYLRIQIVHRDVQLITIFLSMCTFGGVWFVSSQILSRLLNVEANSAFGLGIHVGMFYLLLYVAICLRMIAHFFGKYFAICNRSAYGALMSDDDRGGMMDLAFVIIISLISFTPLIIGMIVSGVMTATLAYIAGPMDAANGDPVVIGMTVTGWIISCAALLPLAAWAYFYFPMATAVAAIEYTVNPMRVLHWCTVCFSDYVKLLLLYIPFWIAVLAFSFLVQSFLVDVLPTVTVFPKGIFMLVNFFIISNFFTQYINVVGYTSLGLIARMHEPELGWYR